MKKKTNKRVASWLLLMVLCTSIFGGFVMDVDAVTPSKENYNVYINGTSLFISNKQAAGSEVGTEYFMTYTVKSVSANPMQHGLCGTDTPETNWPFNDGGFLRWSNEGNVKEEENFLMEGATYFLKFTVAKGGFQYAVTRVKNDTFEDLYLEGYAGDGTDKMEYFGLWFGMSHAQAELTNVRCYDANGRDLGVRISENQGQIIKESTNLKKDTKVNHRYEITINNQTGIAISHVKVPTSSRVYMEYKVESADYVFQQEGIALSNSPLKDYPHSQGRLQYNLYGEGSDAILLLDVGAEYIICMERTANGYTSYVQKTKNGVRTLHVFSQTWEANWDETSQIFSLWFGDKGTGNLRLVDVKFYDENKNDLKVQCNRDATIIHRGAMEDYAGCEATYYCKETKNSFALYKNQSIKRTMSGETLDGTYKISDNVMSATIGKETEKYDYLYAQITDKEENVYERLYHYKVRFVTEGKTKIETQTLSNETGYFAMRPTDPVLDGYQFEGWCLNDGTPYDFEQMVHESITLYAKYVDENGDTLLADDDSDMRAKPVALYIAIGSSILLVAVVVSILIIRRRSRNA